MTHFKTAALAFVIAGLATVSAHAGQIGVTSYSGPNGGTGAHNYWDATYSNCPASNCVTDGAPLSGGTGALTDGVIASQPWFNLTFPGEYVGWLTSDPTITFNFGSVQTVNEVKLYVDNSHVGAVTAPDMVFVDGTEFDNPAWAFATPPQLIDITGLSITADHISIQLHDTGFWVFLSEAQFFNSANANGAGLGGGVPEPASWALMLLGFFGLGGAVRASRRRLAAA